jgi:hypothetical protein
MLLFVYAMWQFNKPQLDYFGDQKGFSKKKKKCSIQQYLKMTHLLQDYISQQWSDDK